MNNKIIVLLVLLVLLVAGNLGLTAYLAFRPAAVGSAASAAMDEPVVSDNKANELAKEFLALYNKNDSAELYGKLDNYARVQLSQDKLTEQLQKLHSLLGNVSNFSYTHADPARTHEGKTFFTLNYRVALSGGQFEHGAMKLTFVKNSDGFGLVGFFMNGLDREIIR